MIYNKCKVKARKFRVDVRKLNVFKEEIRKLMDLRDSGLSTVFGSKDREYVIFEYVQGVNCREFISK